MPIPLLIISNGEEEFSEYLPEDIIIARQEINPYVVRTSEGLLKVLDKFGSELKTTIAHPLAQFEYDKLIEAGYKGKFIVLAPEHFKDKWGERKVEFVNIDFESYNFLTDSLLNLIE